MRSIAIFVIAAFLWALPFTASAAVQVKGYTRKDGTYVAPYVRSAPDGILGNNYSAKGNVNPYTGAVGTKTVPLQSYIAPTVQPASAATGAVVGGQAAAANLKTNAQIRIADFSKLGTPVTNSVPMANVSKEADVDDQANRIQESKVLLRLGLDVDWQKYSFTELAEMEREASRLVELLKRQNQK